MKNNFSQNVIIFLYKIVYDEDIKRKGGMYMEIIKARDNNFVNRVNNINLLTNGNCLGICGNSCK